MVDESYSYHWQRHSDVNTCNSNPLTDHRGRDYIETPAIIFEIKSNLRLNKYKSVFTFPSRCILIFIFMKREDPHWAHCSHLSRTYIFDGSLIAVATPHPRRPFTRHLFTLPPLPRLHRPIIPPRSQFVRALSLFTQSSAQTTPHLWFPCLIGDLSPLCQNFSFKFISVPILEETAHCIEGHILKHRKGVKLISGLCSVQDWGVGGRSELSSFCTSTTESPSQADTRLLARNWLGVWYHCLPAGKHTPVRNSASLLSKQLLSINRMCGKRCLDGKAP